MGARRIPLSHQSITGLFPSRKNGCSIPFESGLERDLCYQLEFDDAVKSYASQPVAISYVRPSGRRCRGFPDFLVEFHVEANRPDEIRDVKPRSQLRHNWKDLKPRLRAACEYARARGKLYRLQSEVEIRNAFLPQWKFLYRYLCLERDAVMAQSLLTALTELVESTPQRLVQESFGNSMDRAMALPTLWNLIASRAIRSHLDRPLTMASKIWVLS